MIKMNVACVIAFFACLFCFPVTSSSQSLKVSNIHYRTIGESIEIFYDLPVNHDSLKITIAFRKKSAPKFKCYPKYISGDVGIGVFSGSQKKIEWSFKKEPASIFTGSGFYFKISAIRYLGSKEKEPHQKE